VCTNTLDMRKTKDYLHDNLSNDVDNDKVFQKTYQTIEELSRDISESQIKGFGIKDRKMIAEICSMNAVKFSDKIIELVNYTIENFKK
jgi:hypothetical protein